MCLILFSWQASPNYPLVVAANRDEFYQRPTTHLTRWRSSPVIAGRDLQAGGTWMGITEEGRFAAVTNYRQASDMHNRYPLSRGKLCQDFLEGTMTPEVFLQKIASNAMGIGGFNLLVSDGKTLGYGCNRFGAESGTAYYDFDANLPAGVYGLSNHRLDTPWPKVRHSKQLMKAFMEKQATSQHPLNENHFLAVVADESEAADHHLPDTGIGLHKERFLSPAFIRSSLDYGTRASTILIRHHSGQQTMIEQTWLPGGKTGRRTMISL